MAFPPDYASSRLLYVYFTNGSGDLEIAELHADADGLHADPATLRPVLIVPHPNQSNHNGGQLQFGPDGFLYAGTGDGGGGRSAGQRPEPELAAGQAAPDQSVLRIRRDLLDRPAQSVPLLASTWPPPGQPRIAIGDVGQDRFEEIDYLPFAAASGANFGWNDFEGFAPFAGAHPPTPSPTVKPIKVYSSAGGACAIIGGYVVRDPRLRSLFHRYVYGDFCTGKIRSLIPDPAGPAATRRRAVRVRDLSSFGEGAGGALYATSLDGPVYRFVRRR